MMSNPDEKYDLDSFSKEELVDRVRILQTQVAQLRNLLGKSEANIKSDETTTNCPSKRKQERHFDFTKHKKRHVALKIAYLGWDYMGYVTQPHVLKSVEDPLFEALLKTKLVERREASNYHRCGRTDRGVSAFGQVISLDVRSRLSDTLDTAEEELPYVKMLNGVLPEDIRVLAWAPVSDGFSSRFDCTKRMYKYYFPKGTLDIEKMKEGGKHLVGEHDFRNLSKFDATPGKVNCWRRILSVDIERIGGNDEDDAGGYCLYQLTIVGSSFLWHQIRCIVAVLFLIGQNREAPTIVCDLLDVEKNPRKPQYTMASEIPLVLFDATFDNHELNWIYERESLRKVIEHLQGLWTNQQIRATTIRSMLRNLESTLADAQTNDENTPVVKQQRCLEMAPDVKVYKRLMERPTCESPEDRLIAHLGKRRKVQHDSPVSQGDGEMRLIPEQPTNNTIIID